LKWLIKVVRTPEVHDENRHKGISAWEDRCNGLSAYSAWADALSNDEDFATDDISVLRERFMVHYDAVGAVAEGRWYRSLFISQIARQMWNRAEDLYKSASCYSAEHDLMWADMESRRGIGVDDNKVRN